MELLEARTLLAGDDATEGVAGETFAPHVIDLMVLYTPRALRDAEDVATVRRQVRRAVADTNQIMANSLIDVTVRLVHVQQVEYEEKVHGDPGDAASDLKDRADVTALRERYGADLVTFWLSTALPAGVAYMPGPTAGVPYPWQGFNAVMAWSANTEFTLSHEIGHNLGLTHGDALNFRVHESAPWPYSDVMGSQRYVPFYSNPDVTFHGVPLGVEGRKDGASIIRAYAPDVASYMPTRVTTDVPPIASLGTTRLQKGGRRLVFDVRLLDDIAIDVTTISSGDFTVRGPKGFSRAARLVRVDHPTNGAIRTATYRVTLPSAARSPAQYRIRAAAGAVEDVVGNALPAGRVRVRLEEFPDIASDSGAVAYDLGNIAGEYVRLIDEPGTPYGDIEASYYRFELDRTSRVSILLEGVPKSQRLSLYPDSNGDEWELGEERLGLLTLTSGKGRLTGSLPRGTYFVIVDPRRSADRFTLELSALAKSNGRRE